MVSTRSSKKPTPHEKKIKLVEQIVISSSSETEDDDTESFDPTSSNEDEEERSSNEDEERSSNEEDERSSNEEDEGSSEDEEEDFLLSVPEELHSNDKLKKTYERIKKDIKTKRTPNICNIMKSRIPFQQKVDLFELYVLYDNAEPFTEEQYQYREVLNKLLPIYKKEYKHNAKFRVQLKDMEKRINILSDMSLWPSKIINLPTSEANKEAIFKKYHELKTIERDDEEYGKLERWMKVALALPFNNVVDRAVPTNRADFTQYLCNVKKKLDERLYGMTDVKEQIMLFLHIKLQNPTLQGCCLGLIGSVGTGKCFQKDTPILMYDGTQKMVQDVCIGDKLMGDDSRPRNVLDLGKGIDKMYKITNTKGLSYVVNSEHILCLKYSSEKFICTDSVRERFGVCWFNNKMIKKNIKYFNWKNKNKDEVKLEAVKFLETIEDTEEDRICEISVKKYLQLPKHLQLDLKGYSTSIDFEERLLEFDPYIMGLWLGDGDSTMSRITNQDSSILHYLSETLPTYNCYLRYSNKYSYRINGDGKVNPMMDVLRKYDLINNKHIPLIYKCNSRENRLKLLAGIIDSDGHYNSNGYEITQCVKHERLFDDIIYLCRSLGFSCYKKVKSSSWTHKDVKYTKDCFRIHIHGDGLEQIPVLCPRKKALPRQQIKDVLVSGIKVEEVGVDNYYGFMIDGNERFVLGNFIVTHNTSIAKCLSEIMEFPFQQISFGGINNSEYLKGFNYTYVGSRPGEVVNCLLRMKYSNGILFLDEYEKVSQNPDIISTLLHITDFSQNSTFRDNYLCDLEIDLSRLWFIYSMNEMPEDSALRDRIFPIYIKGYNHTDKVRIIVDYLFPKHLKNLSIKNEDVIISDSVASHIIQLSQLCSNEKGIRTIEKAVKDIVHKISFLKTHDSTDFNHFSFVGKKSSIDLPFHLTNEYVDRFLVNFKSHLKNNYSANMYI